MRFTIATIALAMILPLLLAFPTLADPVEGIHTDKERSLPEMVAEDVEDILREMKESLNKTLDHLKAFPQKEKVRQKLINTIKRMEQRLRALRESLEKEEAKPVPKSKPETT